MEVYFFTEGYLDLEDKSFTTKRLFVCNSKDLIYSKSNISNSKNKNFTILLDDIQRLNDTSIFNEIYLVSDTFFEIPQDILEELKTKCQEIWLIPNGNVENFNIETILKNFTK